MPITSLNHVNIRTLLMEETKDFYVDVVGLTIGDRPPFDTPGYWLYCGDQPIVHLSPSEPDSPPRTDPAGMGDGLDHVGLFAAGLRGFEANLKRRGIAYDRRRVADGRVVQLFLYDPNGVLVEVGFDAAVEGVRKEKPEPAMA